MTSLPSAGLPVPPELQRGFHRSREAWVDSGLFVVEVLCRAYDRDDLAGLDVLDVGCGTKVVKTLLDDARSIGRYVGIDVSQPVIEWLKEQVTDPRFEFHHLNAHNDLYNPGGTPLSEFAQMPTDLSAFDLICLFSVFTHLAPDDYVAMLRLLRRHVRPDGRLVFSVFLNDPDHPSLLALALEAALASPDPAVVEQVEQAIARVPVVKDRRFVDEVPDQPLLVARYDKDFALELIEGTGWEVVSIDPPNPHIQFAIVCQAI